MLASLVLIVRGAEDSEVFGVVGAAPGEGLDVVDVEVVYGGASPAIPAGESALLTVAEHDLVSRSPWDVA